jgi:GH24 family phage-related lysozyme (muramidase)
MKAIGPLVKAGDLAGIAGQIVGMKRLWADTNLQGLLDRRDREAALVRDSQRSYAPGELVLI